MGVFMNRARYMTGNLFAPWSCHRELHACGELVTQRVFRIDIERPDESRAG